ncbi:uncharacterized protein V6R79_025029 [Siganus canaliculatus]
MSSCPVLFRPWSYKRPHGLKVPSRQLNTASQTTHKSTLHLETTTSLSVCGPSHRSLQLLLVLDWGQCGLLDQSVGVGPVSPVVSGRC